MQYYLFLFLFFMQPAFSSQPIAAKDLYKYPEISQVKVSPGGRYISAYVVEEGRKSLSLSMLSDKKLVDVINFGVNDRLLGSRWIDDEWLHLHFGDSRNEGQGVIHVEKEGEKFVTRFYRVRKKWEMVNPLPAQKGKAVFSVPVKKGVALYEMPVEGLVEGDISAAKNIGMLEGAVYYDYDSTYSKYMGYSCLATCDEVGVWYLKDSDWELIHKWRRDEYSFIVLGFSSGSTVLALTDATTPTRSVAEYSLETNEIKDILYQHELYDISTASLSNDGSLESVGYFDSGSYVEHHINKESADLYKNLLSAFDDSQIVEVSNSHDDKVRVIKVFSDIDLGGYYSYEAEHSRLTLVKEINPSLKKYRMFNTASVVVDSPDGVPIEGYLTQPEGLAKGLLVMPHGGPIGVRDTNEFNRDVQYFASRGYAVLRVNFRGSEGFGKEFRDSGVGEFGRVIEDDISLVVDHVTKKFGYDQACAIGSSYGGYSSVMLAISNPSLYSCIVAKYGVYDLQLLFSERNYYISDEFKKYIERTVGDHREDFSKTSPVYHVRSISQPVLLMAGEKDRVASIEHSNRMRYLLDVYGKNHDSVFYPKSAHGQSTVYGKMHEMAYVNWFVRSSLDNANSNSVVGDEKQEKELLLLAKSFHDGGFVEKDIDKAEKFYRAASEMDNVESMYGLATIILENSEDRNKLEEAVAWLERSFAEGYFRSGYQLGNIYYKGKIIERDVSKAFDYTKTAFDETNDPLLQLSLAKFYCLGDYVDQDIEVCVEYLNIDKYKKHENSLEAFELRRTMIEEIIADGRVSESQENVVKNSVQ